MEQNGKGGEGEWYRTAEVRCEVDDERRHVEIYIRVKGGVSERDLIEEVDHALATQLGYEPRPVLARLRRWRLRRRMEKLTGESRPGVMRRLWIDLQADLGILPRGSKPEEVCASAPPIAVECEVQVPVVIPVPVPVRDRATEDELALDRILVKPIAALEEMGLSSWARDSCRRAGMEYVLDIASRSESDLREIKQGRRRVFTDATIGELREVLGKLGLHFGFNVHREVPT